MRAKDALGAYGERVAAAHLVAAGMTVLDRNWRCPIGEIDIVARDGDVLVVCEVKTRRGDGFGHPLEAVTARKAARLRRLAARLDRRAAGAPAGRADRPGGRAAAGPRRGRRRARAGGGLSGRWPGPGAWPWSGVDGHLVEVEADLGPGVPSFSLVGLPDASLTESRDRVRAAMVNSEQHWPATQRVTVNLSPASLPKRGSSFDLAIAVGDARGRRGWCRQHAFDDAVLLGELGLDGRVRPVRGVLPAVLAAARAGVGAAVVPAANAAEAALVPGVRVTGVRTLAGLVARANGGEPPDVELAERRRAAGRPGRGRPGAPAGPGRRARPGDARATCSRWPRPAATTC